MPGPNPSSCSASIPSDLDPGLEFFVDVANATYDGQTAELPIKMRNVKAADTITLIRADFKIEMTDVYDNLVIIDDEGASNFLTSVNNNLIIVTSNFTNPNTFQLDSLQAVQVGKITLEAPSDPITGGEAIFEFLYTRVFIKDALDLTPGLNHCCKPPGIGDTLQIGNIFPCQVAGSGEINFADVQYDDDGMTIPVYLENLNNPQGSVTVDSLFLEIQVTTSGDLLLDSLATINSLSAFPGCSQATKTVQVSPTSGTASIEVLGNCEILSGTDNLFSLIFSGTGGCVQTIKVTIAEFDPNGLAETCVPLISEDMPLPCWRQKGEIFMWCDSTPIPDVTISQDSLGAAESLNCRFETSFVNCEQTETTDSQGAYSIEAKASPLRYGLTPIKTDDPKCGVSTFDLILISKHILGVNTLTVAEKWIAADVNSSGTISTQDLIAIRKLVLSIVNEFPQGSWQFIPANYAFVGPITSVPTGYPQCLAYPDSINIDFRAIKIGDVNCSCNDLSNIQDTLEVSVNEVIISGGRKLEFEPLEFDHIAAFQFGFDFDADDWVYQEEIVEDLPFLTSDAVGTKDVLNGNLKLAWYDTTTTGKTLQSGEKMLSLEFDDEPWVSGGSLLTDLILNEADIPALAYQEDGTPMVIRFVSSRGSRLPSIPTHSPEAISTTVAIQPNPTSTGITFNIQSPQSTPAGLIIYDTQGKEVHKISLDLEQGETIYRLDEINNWQSGLYWYRLETGTESLSGKILKK